MSLKPKLSLPLAGALLLFCAVSPIAFAAEKGVEEQVQQEILALIDTVAESDCQFERNGRTHDAEAAADHLRLKYRRGKRYADTTAHFIERLASRSSITRRPYYIVCGGQERQRAEAWLKTALDDLRDL